MDREVRGSGRWVVRAAVLVVTLALAVLTVIFWLSLTRWASADRSIESARLRLGQVTRGDLIRNVSVQGRIVAADRPTLVSPAQGVVFLRVKAGDVVEKGATLARIESPELQNILDQEKSTLLSKEAEIDRIAIEARQTDLQNQQEVSLLEVKLRANGRAMERAKALFDEGLGSSIDYQKAVDDLEVARLELGHAREKARLARETMEFESKTRRLELQRQKLAVEDLERKVDRLAVVSPVNGLVSRVEVKDKDTVQPNQALFSVVDLSRFEIEILVPENFGDEIGIGTRAIVLYEGKEYEGQVKSLSPEVENSQFKGIVSFSEESPSGLKQNQRVNTRLLLDSRFDVLKVPRGPFLESMGGRQAYVVTSGVAVLRPIEVGAVSVTEVEILGGLEEGEQIVLSDLSRFEGAGRILLRQ